MLASARRRACMETLGGGVIEGELIRQFAPMPTLLELIEAERADQAEEEARPPFRTVDAIRVFITDTKPARTENVTLEMCVLSIEERERTWYLELVDEAAQASFERLLETITSLDSARRTKYVFQLTLWKSRDAHVNFLGYREGFCYRFEKVHSLQVRFDTIPGGSIQIQADMPTTPLPPQVDEQLEPTTPSTRAAGKRKARKDEHSTDESSESPTKKSRAP